MPLQTGAASLMSVFMSAGALLFVVGGVGSCSAGCGGTSDGGSVVPVLVMGAIFLTIGSFMMPWSLMRARKRRASDVVFDSDGLMIEGGDGGYQYWAWREMDPSRSEIRVDPKECIEDDAGERRYGRRLVLEGEVVAASLNLAEQRSFEVVLEAVRAGAAKQPAMAAATAPVEVLSCRACGAPVGPDDEESVACASCGARVPVPPDLRERVRAARVVGAGRARTDALVAKLLRQPGAARTNRLLFATGVALYLAIPAATLLAALSHVRTRALFPAAFALLVIALVRADIADRTALRAILTGFVARAPSRDGAPSTCRRCGAPLPEPPAGGVVSRCVHCSAANVMGLDLRAQATATTAAGELESALASRRLDTALRIVAITAAAAMVAVGILGH